MQVSHQKGFEKERNIMRPIPCNLTQVKHKKLFNYEQEIKRIMDNQAVEDYMQ